jgi:hypothetical protein
MKLSNPNRRQRAIPENQDEEKRIEWQSGYKAKAVILKDGRVGYIQRKVEDKFHVLVPQSNWPFPDWVLCTKKDFKNYNPLEGIEEAPF